MGEGDVRVKNVLNAVKRLLEANLPFPFVVLLDEVIKGLADRGHVRDERLVVIDQNNEGEGSSPRSW